MIPEFTIQGLLPEGEHECSWEEFECSFVYNDKRKIIYRGLKILVLDLQTIGCKSIFISGSFVTKKSEPRDIDICWEDNPGIKWSLINSDFQILFDLNPPRLLQQQKYLADVFPAIMMVGETGVNYKTYFKAHDKTNVKKGIIKLEI